MPIMDPTPAKKTRKVNFSASETLTLIEEYKNRKHLLQSKFRSTLTNKEKRTAWQQITDAVNAIGTVERTVAEIKEKWSKLSTEAKVQLRARKNPPTGSGTADEMPNLDIMADIFEGSSLIEGIKEGGFDSGESKTKDFTISLPSTTETTQEEGLFQIVLDDAGNILKVSTEPSESITSSLHSCCQTAVSDSWHSNTVSPSSSFTVTSLPSATCLPSATVMSLPPATVSCVPSATAMSLPSATAMSLPPATVSCVPSATAMSPAICHSHVPATCHCFMCPICHSHVPAICHILVPATVSCVPSATAMSLPSATAMSLPPATVSCVPSATAMSLPSATAMSLPSATVSCVPPATAMSLPSATSLPSETVTCQPSATMTSQPPTSLPRQSSFMPSSSGPSATRHFTRVPPAYRETEKLYAKYLTTSTELKEVMKTQLQRNADIDKEVKELQKEKLKAEIQHVAVINKLKEEKLSLEIKLLKQKLGQE